MLPAWALRGVLAAAVPTTAHTKARASVFPHTQMAASYLRLVEMPDAQPPVMLTPVVTPQHLTTTELRQRLVIDRFIDHPHFLKEFADLCEQALPHELTDADMRDPRAPTVAGKPVPVGARASLCLRCKASRKKVF